MYEVFLQLKDWQFSWIKKKKRFLPSFLEIAFMKGDNM